MTSVQGILQHDSQKKKSSLAKTILPVPAKGRNQQSLAVVCIWCVWQHREHADVPGSSSCVCSSTAVSITLSFSDETSCHFLVSLCQWSDQWKNMSKALTSAGHSLVAVEDNLIDVVWTDRPERPSTQLRTLGLEYTGQYRSHPSHTLTQHV